MTADLGRRADLLVFSTEPARVIELSAALADAGIRVDNATSMAESHARFFECGGHDALLVAPDVPLRLSAAVAHNLRELDDELLLVVFGEAQLREPTLRRVTRLCYHPTSRAGIGAVLKLLVERAGC